MRRSTLLFLMAMIVFTSCEKEIEEPEVPKPLTKKEILVKNTWQVDELFHNISAENTHYLRGGINTTGIDYDVLRFTFKENGTGTHINQNGTFYETTWEFTTTDQRNLKLKLIDTNPTIFSWNLLEITEEAVHGTVPIILGHDQILESFRMVPVTEAAP